MEMFRVKGRREKLMEKSIRGYWSQKHLSDKVQLLEGGRDSERRYILNASLGFCCCPLRAVGYWLRWTLGLVCPMFKISETLQDCRLSRGKSTSSDFFFNSFFFNQHLLMELCLQFFHLVSSCQKGVLIVLFYLPDFCVGVKS